MKLLLGCGDERRAGWVHHDRWPRAGVDVAHDLERVPWPWRDGTATCVEARHVLEHLSNTVAFMDECWRILKPGGELRVAVPDWRSENAWRDPTHVRAFHVDAFAYFDPETNWGRTFGRFYTVRGWLLLSSGVDGDEIRAVLKVRK